MRNSMDYIYTAGDQKILIEAEQNGTRRSVIEQYIRCRKQQGMTIADAVGYDLMLRVQEKEIEKANDELRVRKRAEESKRKEVIHAKTDKATIEKLKEKKYQLYQKAVQKSEEQFIDEFVSNARVMAGAAIH